MKKTLAIALVLLSSPAFAAHAEDAAPAAAPAAEKAAVPSNSGPKQFVDGLSKKVFGIMNDEALDTDQKQKALAGIFNQYADSKWMAMFVAGKYGKQLTPAQKSRYLKSYHDYLVYNYVPRFQEYTGKDYEILRVQEKGQQTVVQVKLKGGSGSDIRAEYLLRKGDGGYKVVDLSGEGVSLITTQRSDFGGLIGSKGWDYFLDKLDEKVKKIEAEKGKIL